MRVLLTCDPELPVPPEHYGGVQRIVASLVQEIASSGGIDVGLLAHKDSKIKCAKLYSWPVSQSQGFQAATSNTLALSHAVSQFAPDVIHSFSRLFFLLPVLMSSTPKIMSYQRSPGAQQIRHAAKLAGDSLYFTGCSEHIADSGAKSGGNWRAIHNFVDLNNYTYVSQVSPDAPLLFLSRLERIKGVHTAIAIAKSSGRKLIIAGNKVDSEEACAYFESEIRPQIEPGVVEYVGPVDDAQKNVLYGKSAALVLPIEWEEPFGIVFAEALACGTPVIATGLGSVPEIIEDSVHGFIISDTQTGVEAVRQISRIDRQVCFERAQNMFSLEVVAGQYLSMYKEVSREG